MVDGNLTRREFLSSGILATLGAGLASCGRLNRLVDFATPEDMRTAIPTIISTPTPTIRPTLMAEAPPTPTPTTRIYPTEHLQEAMFYQRLDENKVSCQVCFRNCTVPNARRGFCTNKINRGGRYYSLVYGRPSALQIDPIEKEPHYHMLPETTIFCTGTAGCNNRCKFCQNWHLSQKAIEEIRSYRISPEETVQLALDYRCDSVSFTYNEPTVFYEHMFDVAQLAKEEGFGTLFHTNGGMQEQPLAALLEYMDAVTVDLKAFTPEFYQQVSSSELEPVLRTLKQIYQSGSHLEIVNLVVPTLNDDIDDIRRMCRWIGDNLGDEVPLHFSRFFPAYKLTSLPATPIETLEEAALIADEQGMKYVYIGNVPGHERNSTFCPQCGEKIIKRIHFAVLSLDVLNGKCRFCSHGIPGIWEKT